MWYAKSSGSYDISSTQAKANATEIARLLDAQGWSRKSICALLGNVVGESGLNPWRWQSDFVPQYDIFLQWDTTEANNHGYGLFQFTPANKYINDTNKSKYASYGYKPNFFDTAGKARDGEAQIRYFLSTAESSWLRTNYNYYSGYFSNIGVDISKWYYTTFANFVVGRDNSGSPLDIASLTGCFELCYERPSAEYAASSYQTRVDNANYWNKTLPASFGTKKSKWIYYMKGKRRNGY